MRRMYHEIKSDLKISPEKGIAFGPTTRKYCTILTGTVDENALSHLGIARKFQTDRPKIYYVGKDFAQAMSGIDREIPADRMPKNFFGYIAFGKDALKDESHFVEGVYTFIGPADQVGAGKHYGSGTVVWLSYVPQPSEEGMYPFFAKALFPLIPERISQIVGQVGFSKDATLLGNATVPEHVEREREKIYRAVINTVLYIHSQDPDLRKLRPEKELSHTQRKRLREVGGDTVDCSVPVVLVSWDYKQKRGIHVDSTWVDTHPRWQRCGPGNSQIKLVWVKEHERRYKSDTITEGG